MTSTTQRVPVIIEKYYVQKAGRNKGEMTWTEGKPPRSGSAPYQKGKTERHTRRLTLTAPTSLPGLLTAIAKALGQSANETEYWFHTRGDGVCIFAFSTVMKAGRAAVAIVNDICSPLGWHRDPDNHWTCLPDRMTSWNRYFGIDALLAAFDAGTPMDGWVWTKPRTTEHDRKVLIAMKTSLRVMTAKRLTAADARAIDRFVVELIRKRKAA